MQIDRMYGPAAPEHGWVPAPRYLMRRARVLALTAQLAPGELLEIGCGAGVLLHEFTRRGFHCTALESSVAARELAAELAREGDVPIQLRAEPQADWSGKFSTVMAFEVLEHIADDAQALRTWAGWLQPGGHLVLSVPAHAKAWTAGDVWAGHYRRYERDALCRLIEAAGFAIERFECYGYPIGNLGEKLSAPGYARRIRRNAASEDVARSANNDRSGIDRGIHVRLYRFVRSPPGRLAVAMCLGLQNFFLATDLGSGYILRARRR